MTDAGYFHDGMPLPVVEPTTSVFWEGCAAEELRIQRCETCGNYRHPPSPICSNCRSFAHTWEHSEGGGRVFSYTIVHHSVHPASDERVPYNVSVIQLDDCGGVRVISNVVGCPNEEIAIGLPVRVTWEPVDPSLRLYRFTRREPGGCRGM